jgi:hypothetical protein
LTAARLSRTSVDGCVAGQGPLREVIPLLLAGIGTSLPGCVGSPVQPVDRGPTPTVRLHVAVSSDSESVGTPLAQMVGLVPPSTPSLPPYIPFDRRPGSTTSTGCQDEGGLGGARRRGVDCALIKPCGRHATSVELDSASVFVALEGSQAVAVRDLLSNGFVLSSISLRSPRFLLGGRWCSDGVFRDGKDELCSACAGPGSLVVSGSVDPHSPIPGGGLPPPAVFDGPRGGAPYLPPWVPFALRAMVPSGDTVASASAREVPDVSPQVATSLVPRVLLAQLPVSTGSAVVATPALCGHEFSQ